MWREKQAQLDVTSLGERRVDATRIPGLANLASDGFWVDDDTRVPFDIRFPRGESPDATVGFELAGARSKIFFDPELVRAGVITCGGVCPGINDVIRALFMELHYIYGVKEENILGFPYGLQSLNPANFDKDQFKPRILKHDWVVEIHAQAGTVLGTSRGHVAAEQMVDMLAEKGVNMLFMIGGDGSQKAAHAIWSEAQKRDMTLAVVGVPKTIDNDINYVYKTFGFDTAVAFAKEALEAAHTEARSHPNGVGLVKLMGRDSGFITAYATLASINVNFALVPEIDFDLDGPGGFLDALVKRIKDKGHALIAVAEGAGQRHIEAARERDESGNVKHADIGLFLKAKIGEHFDKMGMDLNLKYIDPSYMVRALPANAYDSIYAASLARYAVHAAMAGKTDVMVGRRYNQYIHVPIPLAVEKRKKIDPDGEIWKSVLQSTGQPSNMRN